MKIRIHEDNAEKIIAALKAANVRDGVHKYTEWQEIDYLAQQAENRLNSVSLPIKARSGATFTSTSGEKVANSYKYMRAATQVTITRGSKDWFLTDVQSTSIGTSSPAPRLTLTPDQDAEVIRVARKQYYIEESEV